MRASLYLVGFAVASMAGAGLVGMGCSSSSNNGTPAGTEAGTITDDGGGTDAMTPVPDAGTTPCTAAPVNVETLDGGAQWSCLQTACKASLTACAAECECNNAVLASLLCSADGGTPTACFTPLATGDMLAQGVITCLAMDTMSTGPCPQPGTGTGDGGGDAAKAGGEAGADGGVSADTGTASDATGQ